jgi:uncharacterized protein YegP (UPF0339 family)
MPTLRFEVRDAQGSQPYFWRVVDGDRILAKSETMTTKANALDAAKKVKSYAGTSLIVFESFEARNGKWVWHAKTTRNHEIMIASTDYYATRTAAAEAAAYVERNAPAAVVVDMTRPRAVR